MSTPEPHHDDVSGQPAAPPPDPRRAAATSFGPHAGAYERGRPEYPATAVEWMLGQVPGQVVDVGAGTGKLSAAVVRLGGEVVAVDPDPLMLAALSARLPGVTTLVGSAEALPLPDACADAVVFGQSWHWVDEPVASAEVARVVRPGGVLGLVWNVRDDRAPWVAELTRVMTRSEAEALVAGGGPHTTLGPLEHLEVEWEREMSVDEVVAMAASRSAVIGAAEPERARVLAAVRAIAETAEDGGTVLLPYRTHAYRLRVGGPAV